MRSLETELEDARNKYRNWGRWGDDDALGTLNHIGDAERARAAALVRSGRAFSLAQEYNRDGPQTGANGRGNPVHTMIESGLDAAADVQGFEHGYGGAQDVLFLPLQAGT